MNFLMGLICYSRIVVVGMGWVGITASAGKPSAAFCHSSGVLLLGYGGAAANVRFKPKGLRFRLPPGGIYGMFFLFLFLLSVVAGTRDCDCLCVCVFCDCIPR